ncbi:NAD(P)/FAD-dependent oxidoreductase [Myxococcota bacterium]|nr:NAD(P)/FAD-dependent oxidoreductase [Myxococcota bacterium]
MTEHHAIVIIGSGFSGLGMAIALARAGRSDFVVLEQAAGLGGTWRDNRYPGAACDVPSHLYSFSFAQSPEWTRRFAPQPEILAYLEGCADRFDVRRFIRFETEVTGARWDDATDTWHLTTTKGPMSARVVIAGTGPLSRPAPVDIPGLASFGGAMFHSSRWSASADLDGRDVAVIGTGASAIQIVPAIAPRVRRLLVFQRTPPWIIPRDDHAISPVTRALYRAVPPLLTLRRDLIYLSLEWRATGFVVRPRLMKLFSRLAKKHLEAQVSDPVLRDKLTPRYVMGCKRVLLSDDYYPALVRPNVELVTEPIDHVVPDGIVTADGATRRLDAIVLATGFMASEAVVPFPITGRDGVSLDDAWRGGPTAYLGTTVAGFPNLFLIVGPNTGLGHNSMVFMIESQIAYVEGALAAMARDGLVRVEVDARAQHTFNEELDRRLAKTVWQTGGCSSWYQTSSGRNTTLWPGFTFEFRRRTRRFDRERYVTKRA